MNARYYVYSVLFICCLPCCPLIAQKPFIITIVTDHPGESDERSFEIPVFPLRGDYLYNVDWGDGAIETGFTGNAIHHYKTAGS